MYGRMDGMHVAGRDGVGWMHDPLPWIGWTSSFLKCRTCGTKKSIQMNTFGALCLSLSAVGVRHVRLEDLIRDYFELEYVSGVDCEHCADIVTARSSEDDASVLKEADGRVWRQRRTFEKWVECTRWPEILRIHVNHLLSNFAFGMGGRTGKVSTRLLFPLVLRIDGNIFHLRSIGCHVGRDGAGHFYAYTRRERNGELVWLRISDRYVSHVDEDVVLDENPVYLVYDLAHPPSKL
jgi:ubiquitin C-terminal hydrolase